MAVAVALGDVLEDDPPVALNIDSPGDLGVVNLGGAEVTLRPDPVGGVVGRGALGGSGVVLVVKVFLLFLGDVLDQVIGRLVSNVSILLQEESILRDLVSDVIGGVLRVQDTVGKVTALGTLGWGLGVTVGVGGGVVRFGGVGGWCGGIGGGRGVVDGVDSMGGMVDRGNHGRTVVEDLPDQDRYGEYKKGCNLQEEGKVTRRKLRASLAYQFRDHGAGCELKLNCEESRGWWMLYRSVPVRCLYDERTTFRRGTTGGKPRGGKGAAPSGG